MLYKAASKLYLAGEYAVLKPDGIAVILPIPKYTYLDIEESEKEIVITEIEDKLSLLKNSREIAFEYAKKRRSFKYVYKTELYDNYKKLGLGSSASVVVVTIKAILEELKIKYTKDDLFKLSVKAMIKSNINGSMGDIACIVYDKLIEYHSINKDTFEYLVKPIELKKHLNIEFIYTNIISYTQKQIKNIDINSLNFLKFYNNSNKYTMEYIKAISNGDKELLKKSIENLKENFKFLEKIQDIKIYNKEIEEILYKYENSKISGSGLGDYVVSVNIVDNKEKGYSLKFRR